MERKRIYLCLAHMSDEGLEQKYIKEAFDTNWVVPLGPNVNGFEKDLEEFVNSRDDKSEGTVISSVVEKSDEISPCATLSRDDKEGALSRDDKGDGRNDKALSKRVVALASGTSAVHLSLIACGVKPGDEVLVQSFTFCASSHPITYLGATPVFVDSEPETWNMDPDLLEEAIKDRIARTGRVPKAIIPVALYGMPYRIDRIMEIANKYGIPVIEDAAEGFGSRFNGQVLGTFGKYGVLSFNGNKMITTSGGGALITENEDEWREIMMYATQYRESYPYYQHEKIGFNYRMSNICAGIGRGQMTVVYDHIAHHKHVQKMYEELLAGVPGVTVHRQPETVISSGGSVISSEDPVISSEVEKSQCGGSVISSEVEKTQCGGSVISSEVEKSQSEVTPCHFERSREISEVYDSNYWLCTITIDPSVRIKGQENAYKTIVTGAVGGAAGVIHAASSAVTDCQPNDNVEALRVFMDKAQIEARPVWKPMHKQPCYASAPAYVNGVSEAIFKVGMCLPAGPYVSDDDVRYIVDTIKSAIE